MFLVEALFVLVVVVVCVQEVLEDKDIMVAAAAVVVRVVNLGHRQPEEPLALQWGFVLHCLACVTPESKHSSAI